MSDYFEVFDLPRKLQVDLDALQSRFYELSRRHHPDFHQMAGEDVQAAALERSWREARLPSDREHVTTYIRDGKNGFRIRNVAHGADLSRHRWTVDEPRDLEFVRAVHGELAPDRANPIEQIAILLLIHNRDQAITYFQFKPVQT